MLQPGSALNIFKISFNSLMNPIIMSSKDKLFISSLICIECVPITPILPFYNPQSPLFKLATCKNHGLSCTDLCKCKVCDNMKNDDESDADVSSDNESGRDDYESEESDTDI